MPLQKGSSDKTAGQNISELVLSEWLRYKRLGDNKSVQARLVARGRRKYMEVREVRVGDFQCPKCGEVLTQVGVEELPNFLLEPWLFHEKHRPVGECRP